MLFSTSVLIINYVILKLFTQNQVRSELNKRYLTIQELPIRFVDYKPRK